MRVPIDSRGEETIKDIEARAEVAIVGGVVQVMEQSTVAVQKPPLSKSRILKAVAAMPLVSGPEAPGQVYKPDFHVDTHQYWHRDHSHIIAHDLFYRMAVLGSEAVGAFEFVMLLVESVEGLGVKQPVRCVEDETLRELAQC